MYYVNCFQFAWSGTGGFTVNHNKNKCKPFRKALWLKLFAQLVAES